MKPGWQFTHPMESPEVPGTIWPYCRQLVTCTCPPDELVNWVQADPTTWFEPVAVWGVTIYPGLHWVHTLALLQRTQLATLHWKILGWQRLLLALGTKSGRQLEQVALLAQIWQFEIVQARWVHVFPCSWYVGRHSVHDYCPLVIVQTAQLVIWQLNVWLATHW